MAFPYACANHAVKINLGQKEVFDVKDIPSNYKTYIVEGIIDPSVSDTTRKASTYELNLQLMWSGAFVPSIPPSHFVFYKVESASRDKFVLKCHSEHSDDDTEKVVRGFIAHCFDGEALEKINVSIKKVVS